MPRITTQKSNKNLKKEYHLRFFVVLGWMISTGFLMSIVFLIPIYVLLTFYENAYQNQDGNDEQFKAQSLNTEYEEHLNNVYELSQKIKIEPFLHVEVIDTLNQYSEELVILDAVELSGEDDTVLVTLRGQSLTRKNLLAFEKRILDDARFEDFDLPIEVLTKQENLSFNVTFKYHEN